MRKLIAALVSCVMALTPMMANAGRLIRDAEIEYTLRAYATPIFDAANITPEDVRILILDDPTVNAFVAGGLNLFLHTGLIRKATKPGMLIGVIAHETGHIAGAHLSQLSEKSSRATLGAAIGALLGVAAMVGGAGQAGAGVLVGSQNMVQRNFLSGVRVNEQAADQAAIRYLEENDISTSGMLEMFQTLRRGETNLSNTRDAFLSSHPLTSDRISMMRNHLTKSTIPTDQVPEKFHVMHARMLAKLVGFTEPYTVVMQRYPASDTSVAARYARAIAAFKRNKLVDALTQIDALIKESPSDPFFYDTKGQILFEHGKLKDAATAYANATRLMPRSPLMLTDYAKTLIAQDDPKLLSQALALLEQSRELDDSYATTWRELALAYGKRGRLGLSYMALAEEAALAGDYATVIQHTARAREHLEDDPSLAYTLDDLEREARSELKKQREAGIF